jgi:CheY-like chemotaxis protein
MLEARDADPEGRIRNSRVMLVEDVAAMRLYLKCLLEHGGMQVMEADALETARRLLREGPRPTSILLDLELPDGNGLDLLPDVPRGIPVAALTGDDSGETARNCREAGCALVLGKTGKLGDLADVLARLERHWLPNAQGLPSPRMTGLARRYAMYLAQSLLELKEAARRHDLECVRRIGHRLRGTAVHFGYAEIGAAAGELGEAIASSHVEKIDASLATLLERLSDVAAPPQA